MIPALNGFMKLAVFDIDGTLVRGSSEIRFWSYLIRHGRQGPRQLLAYLFFLFRYLPTGGIHTLKKDKAYLTGLSVEATAALARDFVVLELVDDLFQPAVERLRRHLDRGDFVILMSGTLECVARALADHLGVKHVCATLCAERGGRFRSQPPDLHPFGTTKLNLTRQLARELGLDPEDAVVYANSRHDLPLLEAVRTPVAVLPDTAVERVALERDWEILADNVPALSERS